MIASKDTATGVNDLDEECLRLWVLTLATVNVRRNLHHVCRAKFVLQGTQGRRHAGGDGFGLSVLPLISV